jgi:DNA-binding PadR family transcriptional regulator
VVATKALPNLPPLSRNALHVLLAIGSEERHGYAIMREVERLTDGAIRLGPGAIYTTIRKLVEDGLIEETERRPDPELDDQRRRYYRLTAAGLTATTAEVRRLEGLLRASRNLVPERGR